MGHASLLTDIGSYSGTAFVAAATAGRNMSDTISMAFARLYKESPDYEFWRKLLVFHTLAKIDAARLGTFEQTVDMLVESLNAAAELETRCIYRVSAAAKRSPPALNSAIPALPLVEDNSVRIEFNTYLLIELMKLRKSFAIPANLKARWNGWPFLRSLPRSRNPQSMP